MSTLPDQAVAIEANSQNHKEGLTYVYFETGII